MYKYVDGKRIKLSPEEEASWTEKTQGVDARKAYLRQEVNHLRDEKLEAGMPFDFEGDIGPKVMQTATERDRTNYLGSAQEYALQVQMGNGAEMGASIRTSDNTVVSMSFNDGLALMRLIGIHMGLITRHSWTLKDALDAATTQEELDAIDITTGWPT